jgi:hypothetical protein
MKKEGIEGMTAFLKQPYRGYRAVVLIEKIYVKWMVEIIGSGLLIEVWEDELETE